MMLALVMSQRPVQLAPGITTKNYHRCSHSEHEADVKDAEMATDRHWISAPAATFAFGPFRLFPTQRLPLGFPPQQFEPLGTEEQPRMFRVDRKLSHLARVAGVLRQRLGPAL